MATILNRWWPVLLALGLLAVIAALEIGAVVHRAGFFCYTLDDAYIDLAIAKNLVGHGVWGVTAYEFSSAASSILWPLLLGAVFLVTGPNVFAGVGLTLLGAALTVVVAGVVLRRCGVLGWRQFLVLGLVVVLAPLVPVAMTGLEHTGHAAATLWLSYLGALVLWERDSARDVALRRGALLCSMAALTGLLRYEGLFLTAAIVGVLLLQKRAVLAAALAGAAWVPVIAYGIFSTSHEAMWLPNSVAIKGSVGSFYSVTDSLHTFVTKWLSVDQVRRSSHVLVLGALVAGLYLRRVRAELAQPTVRGLMALTFLPAAGLHLLLGGFGYFFRYEMYLVVLGIVVVAVNTLGAEARAAKAIDPREGGPIFRLGIPALIGVACLALFVRAGVAHWRVPRAAADIEAMDHQLAQFVSRYYNDSCVVINDIGIVSYQTDARILDVWGLANNDTARLYMRGRLDSAAIGRLAKEHSASMAAAYDHLLGRDGPPAGWCKVGTWDVRTTTALPYNVCFYAMDAAGVPALREHLREFARTMHVLELREEP